MFNFFDIISFASFILSADSDNNFASSASNVIVDCLPPMLALNLLFGANPTPLLPAAKVVIPFAKAPQSLTVIEDGSLIAFDIVLDNSINPAAVAIDPNVFKALADFDITFPTLAVEANVPAYGIKLNASNPYPKAAFPIADHVSSPFDIAEYNPAVVAAAPSPAAAGENPVTPVIALATLRPNSVKSAQSESLRSIFSFLILSIISEGVDPFLSADGNDSPI